MTPRIEALEAALHGVDNLAGRAVALDALADELGLDVPNLNVPAATAEAAGESPDDAVRAAAGAARKVLEQGKQPRALKGLSMAMDDLRTDNDTLRKYDLQTLKDHAFPATNLIGAQDQPSHQFLLPHKHWTSDFKQMFKVFVFRLYNRA